MKYDNDNHSVTSKPCLLQHSHYGCVTVCIARIIGAFKAGRAVLPVAWERTAASTVHLSWAPWTHHTLTHSWQAIHGSLLRVQSFKEPDNPDTSFTPSMSCSTHVCLNNRLCNKLIWWFTLEVDRYVRLICGYFTISAFGQDNVT